MNYYTATHNVRKNEFIIFANMKQYLLIEVIVFLANLCNLPLWLLWIRAGSNWEKLFYTSFKDVIFDDCMQLICQKLRQYSHSERPFDELKNKDWLLLMKDNRYEIKVKPKNIEGIHITYNEKKEEYDFGEFKSQEWL